MSKIAKIFFTLLVLTLATAGFLVAVLYFHYQSQLPNPEELRQVKYQLPLEIYSRDGQLLARFGDQKRKPVAIGQVPKTLINAFLAAEDARFYHHSGVDYQGIVRALVDLVRTGQKRQGGSTITMQVARNFFLNPEKTYERKIKEILLALKIEDSLSKDEILELYLNKIYLGHHAYGVAAAADVYYGKTLEQLDLAEMAMIAGLPKAPSSYNPIANPKRALARRNHILRHMLDLGMIDENAYRDASNRPITANLDRPSEFSAAPYIAELVRQDLYDRFGEATYTEGYKVYTTVDKALQDAAVKAVQTGLHSYDERHGYRGPIGHLELSHSTPEQIQKTLTEMGRMGATVTAIVLETHPTNNSATLRLEDGRTISLGWHQVDWARPVLANGLLGPQPKSIRQILQPGDLIRLRLDEKGNWRLAQVPQVQGALVSLDSRTGAILALVGGYDFTQSKFDRATDAQRQPGSGFKPILYTAALESGFTAASLFNDAPVVFSDREGVWRPQNYSGKFYGPTRLRVALRKSRNLVSIRLLQEIGLDKVIETAQRFGLQPQQLPRSPTLALGSGTATPLDMARVFSVFANGGFKIQPFYIDKITDANGVVIDQHQPLQACDNCSPQAPRILEPRIHYIMHSLLQDVVRRGTATKAGQIHRSDLAGKTGTTNDQRDAWFNGYAAPIVAVSWVGFDSAKPLGNGETGSKAALPIWIRFMKHALKNQPQQSFPTPPGLITAAINPKTGLRTNGEDGSVHEIFREEFLPERENSTFHTETSHDSVLNTLF